MKAFLVLFAALVLSGCNDEPVNSVEWYESNKDAMESMVSKCAGNPGELNNTPNCVNAKTAMHNSFSKRSKIKW